jgi:hypothetical protein
MKFIRPYEQNVIQKENDLITNRKILSKKQNRNGATSDIKDINFLAEQYDFQMAL